jgi:hypothetical protein
MIYFILVLSLAVNVTLAWYIRKLLTRYIIDSETRKQFGKTISEYGDFLDSIYQLEQFYGEEIIKRTITQTRILQGYCKTIRDSIEKEDTNFEEDETTEDPIEEGQEEGPIVVGEGERVSQEAGKYRRVVVTP